MASRATKEVPDRAEPEGHRAAYKHRSVPDAVGYAAPDGASTPAPNGTGETSSPALSRSKFQPLRRNCVRHEEHAEPRHREPARRGIHQREVAVAEQPHIDERRLVSSERSTIDDEQRHTHDERSPGCGDPPPPRRRLHHREDRAREADHEHRRADQIGNVTGSVVADSVSTVVPANDHRQRNVREEAPTPSTEVDNERT